LEAKGLEFDSVVVLEPEAIVAEYDRGLRMLYVALTRTTRHLAVVHAGRLLPVSDQAPADDAGGLDIASVATRDTAEVDVEWGTHQLVMPMPGPAQGVLIDTVPLPARPSTVPAQRPAVESMPKPSPHVAPVAAGELGDLGDLVAATVATKLAETVRGSVPEGLWPRLLDRLGAELGLPSGRS
jgi:hypothetical protein